MAKIKLEHAPNCYLRTGGAPVEPFCSCGATEAMDEIDSLKAEFKAKDKLLQKVLSYGEEGLTIDETFANEIEQALKNRQ